MPYDFDPAEIDKLVSPDMDRLLFLLVNLGAMTDVCQCVAQEIQRRFPGATVQEIDVLEINQTTRACLVGGSFTLPNETASHAFKQIVFLPRHVGYQAGELAIDDQPIGDQLRDVRPPRRRKSA